MVIMSKKSFCSSSSSLNTDSDWEEEAKVPIKSVKKNSITYRVEEIENPDQYVEQMLAQVKEEANLNVSESISCEISSNSIENPFEDLCSDSDIEAQKITEINNSLAKGFIRALMAFKSTARPVFESPLGKRRGGFLITNDFVSTIEPLEKSFNIDNKTKKYLKKSLKKIYNLQQIKTKNMNFVETQLREIGIVERERKELKEKIEVLSQSLDGILKERRDLKRSTCNCMLF